MPKSSQSEGGVLPVHGFVLAGGKSSRMGVDKATLGFCGRPMVEIAVEKLRGFCADVSIAGNREDLAAIAEVVFEQRLDAGPGAGFEAGLRAARQEWTMFVPVDVPLVPGELLRRWAAEVVAAGEKDGVCVSHLYAAEDQPAFAMIRRECAESFSAEMDRGERKLAKIFGRISRVGCIHRAFDVHTVLEADTPTHIAESWFANVNTEADLKAAERLERQGLLWRPE